MSGNMQHVIIDSWLTGLKPYEIFIKSLFLLKLINLDYFTNPNLNENLTTLLEENASKYDVNKVIEKMKQ